MRPSVVSWIFVSSFVGLYPAIYMEFGLYSPLVDRPLMYFFYPEISRFCYLRFQISVLLRRRTLLNHFSQKQSMALAVFAFICAQGSAIN
jgi:hypothetical protein